MLPSYAVKKEPGGVSRSACQRGAGVQHPPCPWAQDLASLPHAVLTTCQPVPGEASHDVGARTWPRTANVQDVAWLSAAQTGHAPRLRELGCGARAGVQRATATGCASVVSPPRRVCTAAKPCCHQGSCDREVAMPGQAAPLLLLAHLNQIAVYNWIRQLFFKGYTLRIIKIHVFSR